jgi:branched-chain amino acid transport system substrate-binding protein
MRTRAGKGALAALIVLAGCPTRFDPRADTVKSSPDPAADNAYRQARARLDIGDLKEALARFSEFREKWPNDPLAPSAALGEARARLGLNEPKKAREVLEGLRVPDSDPTAEVMKQRTAFLLGLSMARTGDCRGARERLRPFSDKIAPGDDAVELHAALADCAVRAADYDEALREYDTWFAAARPAEKLYLRDQVAALTAKLSAPDAQRLWNGVAKDSLSAAYLGRRVAADRRAAGDEQMARVVLDQSRGARDRVGLEEAKGTTARETDRAIGLVLPLSGKGRALGERALRGALLAADLAGGGLPGGLPIELRVRDSASDPTRAQSAVEELLDERVAAVLGSPDKAESGQAAARAEQLGVPYLALAPDDVRRGELVFKMVRPRSSAARALVSRAQKGGAKKVAVLAPDSAFGRSFAQGIVDAARAANLRVVADVRFPEGSTTFVDQARKIQAARPDALLIPASAGQIALIAPQLAANGLVRMAGVKPTGGEATIYATCDGITPQFLQSTAKYLQGAILAPTFYADPNEQHLASFVERYRNAFGEDPGTLDALAYDAVRAVRLALDHGDGAPSRSALAAQLSHLGESGLTGDLSFAAGGERTGSGVMFVIDGDMPKLSR